MNKTKYPGIYYRTNKDGSRTYYLRLKSRGQQTWLAIGRHITDAKELWNKIKVERAEGKLGVIRPKKYTFRELATEYFEYYKTKAKPRNWDRVKSIIKQLNSYFRTMEISKISTWTIEHYGRKRKQGKISARTINLELDYLRSMLNKAIEWELLDRVPKIKPLPVTKERRARILTEEEIEYVLENVSQDHRDAILLVLDTGMRLTEMALLTPENVDFEENLIKLDDTKSLKARDIPLTPGAVGILKKRFKKNGGRLFKEKTPNRIGYMFSMERRKLDRIPPWRFHDLRHTWATRLLQKGIDPYTLMELGGWSKLEMVTRYLHSSEDRKRAAIATLETEPRVTKKCIKNKIKTL